MIPYGRQSIDDDDIAAVVEVLRGDWLTQGPRSSSSRRALRDATGAAHAVAFANGTAALHARAAAAGLGTGRRGRDLAAVVRRQRELRPLRRRRRPRFVDIDPKTLNLDLGRVPAGCDALVAVHYAGLPVDLAALAAPAAGRDRRRRPRARRRHARRARRQLRPLRHVRVLVPPGEDDHDRRGRRGHDELARARRAAARASASTASCRGPSAAAGTTRSPSSASTTGSPTCRPRSGRQQLAKLDAFVAPPQRARRALPRAARRAPDVELPPAARRRVRARATTSSPCGSPTAARVYDDLRAARHRRAGALRPDLPAPAVRVARRRPRRLPEDRGRLRRLLSLPMFPGLTDAQQDQRRRPRCERICCEPLRPVARLVGARASAVIPLGTQTLSKSPTQFVQGVTPIYLAARARARTCGTSTATSTSTTRWRSGPVILGYADPSVDDAIRAPARRRHHLHADAPARGRGGRAHRRDVPRRRGASGSARAGRDARQRRGARGARLHRPRRGARRRLPRLARLVHRLDHPRPRACPHAVEALTDRVPVRRPRRARPARSMRTAGRVAAVVLEPVGRRRARRRATSQAWSTLAHDARRARRSSTRSSPASASRPAAPRERYGVMPDLVVLRQGARQRHADLGGRPARGTSCSVFEDDLLLGHARRRDAVARRGRAPCSTPVADGTVLAGHRDDGPPAARRDRRPRRGARRRRPGHGRRRAAARRGRLPRRRRTSSSRAGCSSRWSSGRPLQRLDVHLRPPHRRRHRPAASTAFDEAFAAVAIRRAGCSPRLEGAAGAARVPHTVTPSAPRSSCSARVRSACATPRNLARGRRRRRRSSTPTPTRRARSDRRRRGSTSTSTRSTGTTAWSWPAPPRTTSSRRCAAARNRRRRARREAARHVVGGSRRLLAAADGRLMVGYNLRLHRAGRGASSRGARRRLGDGHRRAPVVRELAARLAPRRRLPRDVLGARRPRRRRPARRHPRARPGRLAARRPTSRCAGAVVAPARPARDRRRGHGPARCSSMPPGCPCRSSSTT